MLPMRACRETCNALFVVALLLDCGSSAAQTQNEPQSQTPEKIEKQAAQLKLIKSPTVPYPEEALRKNIQGKVVLSIVVDANGKVSDEKVLSGAPELIQAAIDSVKQWEFEPPAHAPVITNAEVGYCFPAAVVFRPGLKNEKVTLVVVNDDAATFTQDRKTDVPGEMILSITVSAKGEVTNVRVVKSLSPRQDKAAIKTVQTWKFKLLSGNPGALPDDFQLHVIYTPPCKMQL